MAVFAWDESCSGHVRQLDEQHKKLFAIINDLANAMRAGKGESVIRQVVSSLVTYTGTHFTQEEVLMQQTGYPGLSAHKAQHAQLMADAGKFRKELDEGKNPNTVAVLDFLQKWLVNHIRKSDQAYSRDLNAHGVH